MSTGRPSFSTTNGLNVSDPRNGNHTAKRARTSKLTVIAARIVFAAGLLALGTLLYKDLVWRLIERCRFDPNCSHGVLVLPVCGLFAWRGWKETNSQLKKRLPPRSVKVGILSLLTGFVIHIGANTLSSLMIGTIALVFVLRGVLWLAGGRKAIRAYGFAVGYLLFAAPLPPLIREPVVNYLQNIVSVISGSVLDATGIPVFQDGIILYMPGLQLEIAEGCSGLRQLTAFIAASVAVVGWFRLSQTSSILLIAASIPVAVISNVLRIVITGFVYHYLGAEWAKGVFHTMEGLVVVAIGAFAMLWIGKLLVNRDMARHQRSSIN